MNTVRAMKITLENIMDSDAPSVVGAQFVTPVSATILSGNAGTLVETAEGEFYLVPMGEWFRSSFYQKGISQVSAFNQLQDLGLTEIKDKIVRNDEQQEVRGEDNVSIEKVDEAMATNSKHKKKN
jgi:hypothetical protein